MKPSAARDVTRGRVQPPSVVRDVKRGRWLVLAVESPSAELEPMLAEGLVALGGTAVEEVAGGLRTCLVPPADLAGFQSAAAGTLADLLGGPVRLRWDWLADEDWSSEWRRGLEPRRVGRLVVSPTWCAPDLRADDELIEIDPEMAFGTGEHATTRGALRLLQRALHPGASVLDVGTGSAILAIAAARLGAASVIGAESDPDALINARDNIVRNHVPDVRLEEAVVDAAWLAALGEHALDGILANVLSGVLIPLLPHFRRTLRPAGWLILGGIMEREAHTVIEAATACGLRLEAVDLEDEWWGGLFRLA